MLLISAAVACASIEARTTKANPANASFDPTFFIAAPDIGQLRPSEEVPAAGSDAQIIYDCSRNNSSPIWRLMGIVQESRNSTRPRALVRGDHLPIATLEGASISVVRHAAEVDSMLNHESDVGGSGHGGCR